MLLYLNIAITLLLGLVIGLNLKRFSISGFRSQNNFKPRPAFPATFIPSKPSLPIAIQHAGHCFDTLEVRLLIKMIDPSEPLLDVRSLNELINLTNLSSENQRQRRHLFLKELNLKLFLMFGVREAIIRIDDENDKRVKIYRFDDKISVDMIKQALNLIESI